MAFSPSADPSEVIECLTPVGDSNISQKRQMYTYVYIYTKHECKKQDSRLVIDRYFATLNKGQ